jgi:hypothetical protein
MSQAACGAVHSARSCAGLDDSIAMGTIATRMLDKVGMPAFEVSDLHQRIQTFCVEKGNPPAFPLIMCFDGFS